MIAIPMLRSAGELHAELRAALSAMQRAERQAILCFNEILERKLYRELGYSSIHAYAESALGFSRSKTYQFLRLAESLKTLPVLKRSIEQGEVSWTKAREIARVATPATQERWVAEARSSTRRQLVAKVDRARASSRGGRQATPGQCALALVSPDAHASSDSRISGPTAEVVNQAELAADPAARPTVVSFTLDPLELARYEALIETLRKQGRRGSRGALLLEAFALLAEAGAREAIAQARDARPTSLAGASAGCAEGSAECTRVHSASPYQIVVHRCEACGKSEVVACGERRPLSRAAAAAIACDARVLAPGKRNQATIPPALRRAALARDGYRCQAPGCRSAHFLEVHHRLPRAAGGSNDLDNLITLCSACHRLAHEGGLAGL